MNSKALFICFMLLQLQKALSTFTYLGCYPKSAFSGTGTSYTYQSEGYCTNKCSGYSYAAMIDGSTCLCSNSAPSTSSSSELNCDTSCLGYPQDTCGGDDYYSVYSDGDSESSSSLLSSSSLSSLSASSLLSSASASASTSASTSSSSITSATTSSSSSLSSRSSSSSSSSTTSTSTSTSSHSVMSSSSLATPSTIETTSFAVSTNDGRTITSATVIKTTLSYSNVYVTYTAPATSSTSSSLAGETNSKNKSSNGLAKGAIAGITIGSIAAVLIFLAVLLFIWRQRMKSKNLEKTQNAAIAATMIANNHSGRYPEKKRFSNLHDPVDDEDAEFGPVIGSTGDGNNTSAGASNFSRNPSSRFNFNDGLGIRTNSPLLSSTSPNTSGHQKDPSVGTVVNDSGLSRDLSFDDNTNAVLGGGIAEQEEDIDVFNFSDPNELLTTSLAAAGGAPGLRVTNPDRYSVISSVSGLTNVNTNTAAAHVLGSQSIINDSDDDLFKDRVK